MKFQCEKKTLIEKLAFASQFVSSLGQSECVFLRVKDSKLIIRTGNLKAKFLSSMDVNETEEGAALVSFPVLMDSLKTFPNDTIKFATNDKYLGMGVKRIAFRIRLRPLEYEETPIAVQREGDCVIAVNFADFSFMVNQVCNSTASPEKGSPYKQNLTGIYIERTSENLLSMVATDGKRLSIVEKEITGLPEFENVCIPVDMMKWVTRLGGDDVKLLLNRKSVTFRVGDTYLCAATFNQPYVQFRKVIPKLTVNSLTISREDLSKALKRMETFSSLKFCRCASSITANEFKLEIADERGNAEETLDCVFDGERLDFCFNIPYLLSALSNMTTDKVILKFTDPKKAFTVVSEPDSGVTHVIMPMAF